MKSSKPSMRALKIVALVVTVFMVLVFVVVPLFAIYLVDLDKYRPEITGIIKEETGKDVEIGRLSLSLFGGVRIEATDVTVKDPKLPDINILSTPSITTSVSLSHLLRSELGIKKIVLEEPEFNVVTYSDGRLNIAGANALDRYRDVPERELDFSSPSGGYEIVPAALTIKEGAKGLLNIKGVFIESIEIDNGRLFYSIEKTGAKTDKFAELSGIDLKISSIKLPAGFIKGENHLESEELEGKIEGKIENAVFNETRVSDFDFRCSAKGGEAVVEHSVFSIYGGTVSAKGSLRHAAEEPSGSLSVEASGIRFHDLLNSLSDEENLIVGTFRFDGNFTFPIWDIIGGSKGGGNFSVTDGTFPDFSVRDEFAKYLRIPPSALPAKLDIGDFSYMGGGYYIESETLSIDNTKIIGLSYDCTAVGYLGFNGALNFSGDIYPKVDILNSPIFDKLASYIGMDGKLNEIPYVITGTLDDVKFRIQYGEGGDSGGSKSLKDMGKSVLDNILK